MGQSPAACCGSKCGQPTIVSIGDDVCPPRHAGPDGDPGLGSSDALPEWLSDLAPSLAGEEAERAADAWVRCGEELRRRTRQFVRRASCGVPCWFIDQRGGRTVPASYILDESLESFLVETAGPMEVHGVPNSQNAMDYRDSASRHVACECQIAEIRNVWICADGELARRVHGTLRHGCDADLACVMLIDAPSGPIGLVERSPEAREEFLDCMAVLISAQRLRSEPEVGCCRHTVGAPPPEARLRPFGKSLQSAHISGPICVWLAQAAEDLLPGSHNLARDRVAGEEASAEIPGTDIRPPRAVTVQQARPAVAPAAKIEPLLVNIDNLECRSTTASLAPENEGLRGPVPLLTPRRPGVSAGKGSDAARPGISAPAGAAPVRRGSSEPPEGSRPSDVDGVDAGGRVSAPAAVALQKVGAAANGHSPHTTSLADSVASDGLPPVREPPASFDGLPMMMGAWVADESRLSDPTVLSKTTLGNHVSLPGLDSEKLCAS